MKRASIALVAAAVLLSPSFATAEDTTKWLPRTITLDGKDITLDDPDEIESWVCRDYLVGEETRVEIGRLPQERFEVEDEESDSYLEMAFAFVLYDGGSEGTIASHFRRGLARNWYWWSGGDFQLTMKSDGTAYYFDFTGAEDGEPRESEDMFSCEKVIYRVRRPKPKPVEFPPAPPMDLGEKNEPAEESAKRRLVNPKLGR